MTCGIGVKVENLVLLINVLSTFFYIYMSSVYILLLFKQRFQYTRYSAT